ncbi:tannase/feruloyl esterase family alpha/beta hydrolase [Novosphingobium flavum]|uniref:Tannase/feruloyl esterase family alpha/beta hydrolase n=1 Tax=Novosphingobium flavum TaxID=1778672 RepID=A0A7X1FQZ1_9SPHN|nr:tannase/feruloyl esterase family alpha/beta hydrolase [Novosphingobium flavum]MBC2665318.1 tannase/feruloyl esterase family alpha/beta hydrolase [Novosphingobium flavum]
MILMAMAANAAAAATAAPTFAEACTVLRNADEGTVAITDARDVPEGPAPRGPAGPNGESTDPQPILPEHCQITARIDQRTGAGGEPYHIGMELRIPAQWNGRLFYQGGGGMDGMIVPALGKPITNGATAPLALVQGFAVVSTDSGHQGRNFDDTGFAADQQAKLDYGYAAIGKVTQAAKQLIAKVKGRAPDHSYFVGCSNGGREAMIAAQRFPAEFDGVLAGNPAFHLNAAAVLANFSGWAYADAAAKLGTNSSLLFSPADAGLIQSALLKACDGLDGAADGMIFDHQSCRFDVRALACAKGAKTGCLDPVKVAAIVRAYRGPVNAAGEPIAGSWTFDAANFMPDWLIWQTGIPTPQGPMMVLPNLVRKSLTDYFAYPQYKAPLAGGDAEAARLLAASAETAAYTNATSTQYSTFAARGGKLMIVTGWSDPIFSASDLIAYQERLTADTKAQGGEAGLFERLFLVPGMAHCGGGRSLDNFDALTSLVRWVENGDAPNAITAKGKAFPGVERPICAYPQVARYIGKGPLDQAGSFACATPAPAAASKGKTS